MSLVELADYVPNAILDLRYGTTNNILGEAYPNYPALLEEDAALALREVEIEIGKKSLVLVIWDAFRPQEVHDKLMLKEPDPQNVNPNSPHLWGGAVDLTFAFKKGGQLLDIGVDFDELSRFRYIEDGSRIYLGGPDARKHWCSHGAAEHSSA